MLFIHYDNNEMRLHKCILLNFFLSKLHKIFKKNTKLMFIFFLSNRNHFVFLQFLGISYKKKIDIKFLTRV